MQTGILTTAGLALQFRSVFKHKGQNSQPCCSGPAVLCCAQHWCAPPPLFAVFPMVHILESKTVNAAFICSLARRVPRGLCTQPWCAPRWVVWERLTVTAKKWGSLCCVLVAMCCSLFGMCCSLCSKCCVLCDMRGVLFGVSLERC